MKVHHTKTLALNGDCCEFSPSVPNLFVAGCYQLNVATQIRFVGLLLGSVTSREGMVYLMKVEQNGGAVAVEEVSTLVVPGIFDMKWCGLVFSSLTQKGTIGSWPWQAPQDKWTHTSSKKTISHSFLHFPPHHQR